MTPGSGPKAEPGLTDFDGGLLGGESEVGALSVGTYWFAQGVYEITVHPRPASFRLRHTVETDHPLGCESHSTLLNFQSRLRALHEYKPEGRRGYSLLLTSAVSRAGEATS